MLWKDSSKYDDHTSLEAFDALSGQQIWHYDHNDLFSNFAVANDTVYSALDLNPSPINNNFHANFDLFALHDSASLRYNSRRVALFMAKMVALSSGSLRVAWWMRDAEEKQKRMVTHAE